jgi:hypothetical protein
MKPAYIGNAKVLNTFPFLTSVDLTVSYFCDLSDIKYFALVETALQHLQVQYKSQVKHTANAQSHFCTSPSNLIFSLRC